MRSNRTGRIHPMPKGMGAFYFYEALEHQLSPAEALRRQVAAADSLRLRQSNFPQVFTHTLLFAVYESEFLPMPTDTGIIISIRPRMPHVSLAKLRRLLADVAHRNF